MRFAKASSLETLVFVIGLCGLPTAIYAQVDQTGQNAVVLSTNGQQVTPAASSAFVDAVPYAGGTDVCTAIQSILNIYPKGVVVDARGVNSGQSQNCLVDPWDVASQPSSSIILLPSGTITVSKRWTLPSQTRVLGEGPGNTILRVAASFSGGAILQMGGHPVTNVSQGCDLCFGISIGDLTLDGGTNSAIIDGIDNFNAEELSSADHVRMMNITGIGLNLNFITAPPPANNGAASHSGPYSDLSIAVATSAAACVKIFGSEPRGIHGIVCASTSNTHSAISLDGSNTTIENASINGFTDGIYVGANGPAQGNLLSNISGGAQLTNLIHISNAMSTSSSCIGQNALNPVNVNNACDLSIHAAKSSAGNTIKDELPGGVTLTDPSVAMYAVGQPLSAVIGGTTTIIGYSRFSTGTRTSGPNLPSWIVGTSTAPSNPCATGSLYSRTSSSVGTTLWGCAGGSWQAIQ
jgi:Pectate lyase superfamily protein